MLALLDQVEMIVEIVDLAAQGPGGDLPVQNLRRNVRVIGRKLPPAGGPAFIRDPGKAHEFVAERLDAADLHAVTPIAADPQDMI